MAEVFFVASGQGTMTLNGQPYPLTPGTCIAVEPGEHHEVANTGLEDLVLTYFGLRV
jgi:mannose-6-phosphate isomerase-like protein (cupin superfamily)